MRTEEFISFSRGSFELLRWAPRVAAVALPFTFTHGPISLALAVGAIPIAAMWLLTCLLAWRTGYQIWTGVGFMVVMVGSHVVGIHDSEVPLSQGLQWMCLLLILTGLPLLCFRKRVLHFCRLE